MEVLYLFSRRINLGPIEKDTTISEAEVKMVDEYSKEIRSTITSKGNVELSIVKIDTPTPTDDEVLIEISAAPINPSDLALLTTFGGDLTNINISEATSGSGQNRKSPEKPSKKNTLFDDYHNSNSAPKW